MQKRIVITGIGVRCSNAKNYCTFIEALKKTVPGQSEITLFDSDKLSSKIVCQIKDQLKYCNLNEERLNQIAYEAIDDLMEDKAIKQLIEDNQDNILLSYATSLSGNEYLMSYLESTKEGNTEERKYSYMIPYSVTKIAKRLGIKGPVYTTMSACASGTAATGIAIEAIRRAEVEVAIVGGSDSLTEFSSVGFHSLKSLDESYCRPFDTNRNGINIGEGSAFLVLEEHEHAVLRGAKIYAEVMGYSIRNEAYNMTAPQPDGDGAYEVMKDAILDANIQLTDEKIYINAHGTGTRANDEAELKAIHRLFKGNPNVYLSSTKSITGHCLGAAGSIELAVAATSLYEQFIPATAHTNDPLPTKENIRIIIEKSVEMPVDYVFSNSFAFAGNNSSVILKKYA